MNGAYVNAVVKETSRRAAAKHVREALVLNGFRTVRVETCVPLRKRLLTNTVAKALLNKAKRIRRKGGVQFGTFHAWPR